MKIRFHTLAMSGIISILIGGLASNILRRQYMKIDYTILVTKTTGLQSGE
jgi:hypothetical protein